MIQEPRAGRPGVRAVVEDAERAMELLDWFGLECERRAEGKFWIRNSAARPFGPHDGPPDCYSSFKGQLAVAVGAQTIALNRIGQ